MRTQTPSFVVKVKLHLQENVKNHLNKSFHIADSAYNETLSFGLKRFSAMKKNEKYQELLERRREIVKVQENIKKKNKEETKKEIKQKLKEEAKQKKAELKEIEENLGEIRMNYGLTKYQLSSWILERRKQNVAYQHLNAGELQVVGENAYQTLSQVIFYKTKSEKLKFRSKYSLEHNFRNRVNNEGTRLVESKKTNVAYRLYIHKKSTFVDIPMRAFTEYQQVQLLRADKIKYVQIVSKTIRGKQVFYLYIVCQGIPVSKIQKGEGVIGIDPGISTVAYVSKDSCGLVDLVPKDFARKERLIQNLSRKIERSRRVNNPEAYNENGTRKKDVRFKPLSKRAKRLAIRRQKAYRKLTENRRKIQGELVNHIVSQSSVIKIEDLDVKSLQKRKRETRINPKTGRPFSKKRYGKAIFKAAPGHFRTLLLQRANSTGCKVDIISPKKTKPSQYNHITGEFEKKELKTRIYNLTNEITDVQRDLYSAFLITHIENDEYLSEQLEENFDNFYKNMKKQLCILRQKPSRLSWYVA